MDLFELNRKIDRLLFGALPDKPERTYGRYSNDQVLNRESRQSIESYSGSFLNKANSEIIGVSKFNPVTKDFEFTPKHSFEKKTS